MTFLFYPYLFFFTIFFGIFFYDPSWLGTEVFNTGHGVFLIFYLSILSFAFIFFMESNKSIIFFIYILLLMGFLLFFCKSFFVLYFLMEIILIPLLILLLGFGSQVQKIQSVLYLTFYSSFCSMPMLLVFVNSDMNFDFPLMEDVISSFTIFMLILGFLMKFPVYYLHFWLPLVHVESPTSVSMYLAGVVLKFGVFGYLMFMILMQWVFNFFFLVWAFFGMLFVLFMCISSSDSKVMAAYSSIIHMSFLFLLLYFYSYYSFFSVLFMVLGHGYISFLWFYYLGLFYHSLGTRLIYMTCGLSTLSMFFFISFSLMLMFNAGVPLSYSFSSEVLGVIHVASDSSLMMFLIFFYYFGSFFYSISFLLSTSGGKTFYSYYLGYFNFIYVIYFTNLNLFLV